MLSSTSFQQQHQQVHQHPTPRSEATTTTAETNAASSSVLELPGGGPVSSVRDSGTSALLVASSTSPAAFAAHDVQEASSVQQAPVVPKKVATAAASLVSRLFATTQQQQHQQQRSSTVTTSGMTTTVGSSRSRSSNIYGSGHPTPQQQQQQQLPSSIHFRKPQVAPFMSSSSALSSSLRNLKTDSAPWNRFRRPSTGTTAASDTINSMSLRSFLHRGGDDYNYNEEEEVLFEASDTAAPKTSKHKQLNALQWLSTECPTDVLPHVLSFCGPLLTQNLQAVNKFWFKLIQNEATWKVLCQDLYKWNTGDPEPESWKEYYRQRPCVPVDYKSVNDAFNAASGEDIHILLRPGRYYLRESFTVNCQPDQKVTVATMKMPENRFHCSTATMLEDGSVLAFANSSGSYQQHKKKINTGLMRFIMCTSASYNDAAVDDDESSFIDEQSRNNTLHSTTRATLVMRTRRLNEPAIRVLRGHFSAYNINIEHSSHGMDIWNGNAAIQVQPDPDLPHERPVANLHGLRVTSRTGRGVVAIDGGQLILKQSQVQECAATGVYIGGRGTRAQVLETDVIRNGVGSQRGSSRRGGGIARGHSGIYLEQGVADVLDCNVSNNTLTGITAVSHENSTLNLRQTDLLGNGSFQLEIPARNARGIYMHQNRLESSGTGRIRADLTN